MKTTLTTVALLATAWMHAAETPRVQSRSMVITELGVVAAEQPLASAVAVQVLQAGGNAADAAVAANAMMGLVSPMMCGIGGDMFCLVYDARTQKVYGLNASGWAPQRLNAELLRQQGFTNMPINGVHSITVPGTVDGWDKLLRRFGKMKLKQVLRPAIQHAETGFPVTEIVSGYWHSSEALLQKTESARRTFLPQGKPLKTGEIFRNPDLAWSYRQIAAKGRDAFYDGPITERILSFSKDLGGTFSRADFKDFHAEWVEPITTTYRGWTVYEIPPNGQGIAALSMLNIMENFPLSEYGLNSAKTLHIMIEAKKLAYADMLQYVADNRLSKAPVAGMLSKKHAATRASQVDLEKANCAVAPTLNFDPGPDTTYLCVVDKEGNMVSFIQSNYYGFGTGLVPDGCGFALQNRGGLFSLDSSHPNFLAGRKRPLHTIIPALMEKDGTRIAFGIMGGWNQSQAHAQFVSKIADFGLNIQQALDSPRFTKLTFEGCDLKIESRISEPVLEELRKLGHEVQVVAPFADDVGGGQAVLRDARGVNYGASDPRKDGAAVPEVPRIK